MADSRERVEEWLWRWHGAGRRPPSSSSSSSSSPGEAFAPATASSPPGSVDEWSGAGSWSPLVSSGGSSLSSISPGDAVGAAISDVSGSSQDSLPGASLAGSVGWSRFGHTHVGSGEALYGVWGASSESRSGSRVSFGGRAQGSDDVAVELIPVRARPAWAQQQQQEQVEEGVYTEEEEADAIRRRTQRGLVVLGQLQQHGQEEALLRGRIFLLRLVQERKRLVGMPEEQWRILTDIATPDRDLLSHLHA